MFPVQRIRDYEKATIEGGHRLYRVIARHRRTGEPAGHTVVARRHRDDPLSATSTTRPSYAPIVVTGSGLLLKADMLQWLAAEEPQLESIDTFNAESNDHMIAVNERLGYRAVGRAFSSSG